MAAESPLFDDTRKALRFALNADHVQMPRPAMTVAMVEGLKQRMKPKRRRNKSEALAVQLQEALGAEEDLVTTVRGLFTRKQASLTSIEKAAQAGFILQVFSQLDWHHQVLIRGRVLRPAMPCACRRSCCSGWATSMMWAKAIDDTCKLLQDSTAQGAKGSISTLPKLRRAVVQGWYSRREMRLIDLAGHVGCSSVTAAKHRALIVEWLERIENEAWVEADATLGNAGITGTFID